MKIKHYRSRLLSIRFENHRLICPRMTLFRPGKGIVWSNTLDEFIKYRLDTGAFVTLSDNL